MLSIIDPIDFYKSIWVRMSNFLTLNSIYGTLIVNKMDTYQYRPLIRTGIPHINDEILKILDIISILPPDPIIVDGGANIGLITIPVSIHTNGYVYSFEPQQLLYHCLCGSLALNQISNVKAYNLALGASATKLSLPDIDYTRRRDFGDVVLEDTGKDNVEVTTIDNLQLTRLDFLKLDVEKMEMQALIGGIKTIERFRPWCWVEYIRSDLNDLVQFFKSNQYRVYKVKDDLANIVACPTDHTFHWMGDEL